MKTLWGSIILASGLVNAAWAQDVAFSNAATEACLVRTTYAASCVGLSAQVCMGQTPGGDSTAGMSGCYWAEYEYWDARLNAAFAVVLNQQTKAEGEAKTYSYSEPPRVEPLRAMQRAWIAFRDAKCDFERSQWGGGTGGGPATAVCMMHEAADQTLFLERMVRVD